MNKIGILLGVVTVAIIGVGIFLTTKPKAPVDLPSYDSTKLNYFWGNGCPHCAAVSEFFDNWENKDKVDVVKYEVWYDKANSALMAQKGEEICKIPSNELAVPLLITPDGKCFKGDTPIIDYYKSLEF